MRKSRPPATPTVPDTVTAPPAPSKMPRAPCTQIVERSFHVAASVLHVPLPPVPPVPDQRTLVKWGFAAGPLVATS